MIVVAVTAVVKPEQRDEARRVALAMADASRAEPGCRAYRFFADLEHPDRFFLFEEWESDEALARHGQTEHMRVFRDRLPTLLAAPLAVKRYVATDAG